MILYVVRHGETDWNKTHKVQGRTDIPLNDYGRHLARETGEGMKNLKIDLAYTSPLLRAKETAEIILGDRKIPLIEDERIEEFSFGSYEGMCCGGENQDPKSEEFNRFFSDTGNYIPPADGETVIQLYKRTGDFLEELCRTEQFREKAILISTHGAAMTALINRIKGNLSVGGFWKDEVPPNCSVTIIDVTEGKPVVREEGVIFYKEQVKHWKAC